MVDAAGHSLDRIGSQRLLLIFPEQDSASREIPSGIEDLDFTVEKAQFIALPQNMRSSHVALGFWDCNHPQGATITETLDLFFIFCRVVDGTIECICPVARSRVKMRVGNGDCLDPTELAGMVYRLVVNIAETIPEDVVIAHMAEKRSLSDCYRRDSDDAYESGILIFIEDVLLVSRLLQSA